MSEYNHVETDCGKELEVGKPQLNRNTSREAFMQREVTHSYQNTPQRSRLGSEERKNELIEKSQRLQDKLKRLNSGGESVREFTTNTPREKEGHFTPREPREKDQSISRVSLGQENMMGGRRNSYNRLSFNSVNKLASAPLSRQL